MNTTRGPLSSAQVLRQIFFSPLRTSRVGVLPFKPLRNGVQFRFFQQSHCLELREYRPPVEQLRNAAIKSKFVQLVNEENLLDPPTRLEDVLESFDHAEYFLMQVKEEDDDSLPLCKIIHRRTYLEKEKARTILARQNRTIIKQMEINWAIDAHDFSHRKKQLTKFLEKDCKVEITLTTKKRKRAPTVEEIKQTVQGVLDTIKAAGARQTSEMEGELGKQLKITARKVKMEGKDKVQGEEQAKSEK